MARLDEADPATLERGWQRHYMLGLDSDDRRFDGHQTKLRLREFTRQ
jgi:hypothetical protein